MRENKSSRMKLIQADSFFVFSMRFPQEKTYYRKKLIY